MKSFQVPLLFQRESRLSLFLFACTHLILVSASDDFRRIGFRWFTTCFNVAWFVVGLTSFNCLFLCILQSNRIVSSVLLFFCVIASGTLSRNVSSLFQSEPHRGSSASNRSLFICDMSRNKVWSTFVVSTCCILGRYYLGWDYIFV